VDPDTLSGYGADLAIGATDTVSDALPGIAYSAGAGATQGVLDTLSPYLPYLLIGAVLLLVLA
jgi:hypothetical protein